MNSYKWASGNTYPLFCLTTFHLVYNSGARVPRSGACTLAADLYTGYPSQSRRRKSIHPFPMAVEPLCRNTLALSLPSCYLCFEIHKPFVEVFASIVTLSIQVCLTFRIVLIQFLLSIW